VAATTERDVLAALLGTMREEVARHPTWPDVRHKAALLLLEAGETAGAKAELKTALERNPRYAEALLTLAFAELAAGAPRQAGDCAARAVELRPDDWKLHAGAGLLSLAAGRAAEGLARLDEAARRAPGRALAAFGRAHALEAAGDGRAAEAWAGAAERFPALAAKGRDRALIGNPARAVVRREAAFHLAQQGDEALALLWLDRALALDLDDAVDAAARGDLAFAAGDLAAATASFRRALAIDPELVKARVSLAYALGVEGDFAGAIAELEAAIKRKPRYADLRYQLATLLLDRGERARAISQLEAALGVNPSYAAAHFSLGLLRMGDRRWKDAAARFDSARKGQFAPEDALAYQAFCCLEEGDRDGAKSRLKQAAAEDPSLAAAHLGLAIVHAAEEKRDVARAELARYRELDGPPSEAEGASEIERYLGRKAAELAKKLEG
jgi:tetratricopeptide (TPR) repeat protein